MKQLYIMLHLLNSSGWIVGWMSGWIVGWMAGWIVWRMAGWIVGVWSVVIRSVHSKCVLHRFSGSLCHVLHLLSSLHIFSKKKKTKKINHISNNTNLLNKEILSKTEWKKYILKMVNFLYLVNVVKK